MPIVARSTPIFRRRINYVPRPRLRFVGGGRRMRGLGAACVLGQPSTDPNCFTTPAYIEALNLAQDTAEQKQNLLPSGVNDQACYDQYNTPGPNYNPDAYERCIGAQDVMSAAFASAAARGVSFAANPFARDTTQNVLATPAPPAARDTTPPPPPPPPPAQSNAPAPKTVGGGTGQSNAPTPAVVGGSSFDQLKSLVLATSVDSIPNWVWGVGLVGAAWLFMGRSKAR